MPASVERKARARGIRGYRTIKKGKHLIRLILTRKAGPRGGHSVGYKVK